MRNYWQDSTCLYHKYFSIGCLVCTNKYLKLTHFYSWANGYKTDKQTIYLHTALIYIFEVGFELVDSQYIYQIRYNIAIPSGIFYKLILISIGFQIIQLRLLVKQIHLLIQKTKINSVLREIRAYWRISTIFLDCIM